MITVHFFENNSLVLSQLLKQVPSVDDNVKIKGRKGKVLSTKQIEENKVYVHVIFEQVVKKQVLSNDSKKKKR
ncbi:MULTISPECIES: hypothetical protein [Metabacillus]|jgi:hypothetical protein|uniref:Preprotein translocase subunit SecA n=1 Tax=Metabacillus rhizolycopersici TaxID=2875709 RepID=A0ABS7UNX1_9BACI|nr:MULTISPECIES: hypothetical protein [Metabacillus]MBZ5750006.1 hypothetical protein [Metabacillus rhizolycopersici]MCM3654534.1 hypothetical protein [Metabacillus litoralis]